MTSSGPFSLLLSVFVLMIFVIFGADARAQPANDTGCDPQYMDAIEARGWMEAQREVAQNQSFIVKPDSVLEMTCFDQMVGVVAQPAIAPLFSEEGCCNGPIMPTALNTTFGRIVETTLMSYLGANFTYPTPFLGGRGPGRPVPTPKISPGLGYGGCSIMLDIWNSARCMHFFHWEGDNNFYDFFSYQGWDPRFLPSPLGGAFPRCQASPDFNTTPNVAFNGQPQRHILSPENDGYSDISTTYETDPIQVFLKRIMPLGWGQPPVRCDERPPLRTGLCVERRNIPPYADAICPNPGCRYQRPGGGGGGLCANTPNPPLGTCVAN